ncbi:MAG: hypothetical protein A2Y33_10415 [Spirochaetes bacterium GWF1_51_8]|nr:MAG: hypothetical protein A2Y33_10415 [Spirochaetes bacterium GWF1_51_8]
MKILVYTYAESYTLQLAIEMIPKGIEPIETKSKEDALQLLKSQEDIHIVVSESPEIDFLQQVKDTRKDLHVLLLFHQNLKPKDLMSMMSLGITALVEYNPSAAIVADGIIQNILKFGLRTPERRAHLRVQPSNIENAVGAVYLRDAAKFIRGNLIDISAGGAAIAFYDSIESSMLLQNHVYDPVLLQMRGLEIKTIARLKGKRDSTAGFQFENVEEREMNKIATYVHYKMNEGSEDFYETILRSSSK